MSEDTRRSDPNKMVFETVKDLPSYKTGRAKHRVFDDGDFVTRMSHGTVSTETDMASIKKEMAKLRNHFAKKFGAPDKMVRQIDAYLKETYGIEPPE